jgi:hypothetical protein
MNKKRRVTVDDEDEGEGGKEGEESSSSSGFISSDDDDDDPVDKDHEESNRASTTKADATSATTTTKQQPQKKKSRKSTAKVLTAGLAPGDEPLLSLVTTRDSASTWDPAVVEKMAITKVLLHQGVNGHKVHATADALAVFQAGLDTFTAKILGNSLFLLHRLEEHKVLTSPVTGGPYIKGEQKKAPHPDDIPEGGEKNTTIYPRHMSTALKSDPWVVSIIGARTAIPGDVYHPSITIAPPKRKSD